MEWTTALFDLLTKTWGQVQRGGWVMVPIAALSLWMWLLIVRKSLELAADHRKLSRLALHLGERENDSVLADLRQFEWFAAFMDLRTLDPEMDERLLDTFLQRHHRRLQRYLPTIVVLASIAPLLGLLGTVNGMISTFQAIARFGSQNPRALAGGISEALITTQSGLLVAVPGLLAAALLQRYIHRARTDLQRVSFRILHLCHERQETTGHDS